MNLSRYDNWSFKRGQPRIVELMWIIAQSLFVGSSLPGSRLRQLILKLFGAKIGKNVVLKTGLKITFPWRLSIGDNSWVGENVWIDNLAEVKIGNNCCISQGGYLCTGNHDWGKKTFDLSVKKIVIEDSVWLGAMSSVAPNVTMYRGAILTMGSSLYKNAESNGIYTGVPAQWVKSRKLKSCNVK